MSAGVSRSSAWVGIGLVVALCGCASSGPSLPTPQQTTAATKPGNTASKSTTTRAAPRLSNGCGRPPPPAGERTLPVGSRTGFYIVSVPKSYDPAKAYPLGFAFHGRTRNHTDCLEHDCGGFQEAMSEEAIVVYMQSLREPGDQQSGWERPAERPHNLQFFDQVLTQVEADYCVDERRVFLAGTSSGANFANLLGCLRGQDFLAIAPVSGALNDPPNCEGAPAALVIHGIDDSHIPIERGEGARESYRVRSGCTHTTAPPLSEMHARVRAARDHTPSEETLSCVDFEGCRPGSALRWCEHSFGGWDGSTHGWPPVAGKVIWDFVKTLP